MSKSTTIPIAHIKNQFDVRSHLDDDTVAHLADLYKAGVRLPPIEVVQMPDQSYCYVDGRHRAAARAQLGWNDIPAIIQPYNGSDPLSLFAKALQANYGGSKPPTRADIQHTILRMVETGAGKAAIAKVLFFIPRSLIDNLVASASGHQRRDKLVKALDKVSKGSTPAEAAKTVGLDAQTVSDAISGRKRKWSSGEGSVLADSKSHITRVLRASNTSIAQRFLEVLKQIEVGELDPAIGKQILDAWETNIKGTLHRIKDWRERLDYRTK